MFSARVGGAKKNTRRSFDLRVLCSGDVLLSHGLSPYYHRGFSVSLPCSEWERVGPLRYYHQKRAASCSPFASGECLRLDVRGSLCFVAAGAAFFNQTSNISLQTFFFWFSDIYIQVFKKFQ